MAWKKSKGTQEIHFVFGKIPFAKRIAIMGKEQTMSRWIDAEYCEDFFDRWESRVKDADPVTIDVVQNTRTLLRDAPSTDIQRWIPCVEEMPKEFVYVLICLKDGAMYVAQLTDYIDIWGNPKWCTNTKHCLGGAILGSEVIAWKPLPEPYGERESE